MEYYDIYTLRLNRYGTDYQSRIQRKREKEFQSYLKRSVYRIEFKYDDTTVVGSFEKYKQDETRTLHYLLTPININIPNGTILFLSDKDQNEEPWMVYYLERIKASGYNRYIMLRMTHFIEWIARDKTTQQTWAYLYGQEDNMLKDELKSRSRMDTLYTENLKLSFLIIPKNQFLKKDDYLVIGQSPFQEQYRVTGYDIQSTDGVEYVSIDPVYKFDLSEPPEKQPGDSDQDFFWLKGGVSNNGA